MCINGILAKSLNLLMPTKLIRAFGCVTKWMNGVTPTQGRIGLIKNRYQKNGVKSTLLLPSGSTEMTSRRVEKSVPKVPLFKAKKGASFEERCITYFKKYTLYYHVHKEQYRRYDQEHTIDEIISGPIATKKSNSLIENSMTKNDFPEKRSDRDLPLDEDNSLLGQHHHDKDELFADAMDFYSLESDHSPRNMDSDFMTFIDDIRDDDT